MTTTIHILKQGWPLCGFSDKLPGYWPEGHKWIHPVEARPKPEDAENKMCAKCEEVAKNGLL